MSELTQKQIDQIDAFESAVYTLLETVLGLPSEAICCDHNALSGDNDKDFEAVHEIMDLVVEIGERHGIPEMQIYPYLEGNERANRDLQDTSWYFSGNNEEYGPYNTRGDAVKGIGRLKKTEKGLPKHLQTNFTEPYQGKANAED